MQAQRNGTNGATGIQVVHSSYCPTHDGGTCTAGLKRVERPCQPSYRASVYNAATRSRVKRTFSTLDDAKDWRAEYVYKVRRGHDISPLNMTLNDAWAAWLEGAYANPPTILNRNDRPFKPSTLRGYDRDMRKYALPALGAHKLSAIRRKDLSRLKVELLGKGLSVTKVRNVFNPLRTVYRQHADDIDVNPTRDMDLPKTDPRKRASDLDVLFDFLDHLDDDLRALYATAAFAGLRRGELRGLRWSDIELNDRPGALAGWITVARSVDDVEGIIDTKSQAGKRRVPIVAPFLSDELEALRERSGRSGDDYVFGKTPTVTFHPSTIRDRTIKAVRVANERRAEADLEPITRLDFHPCRHTFGAMLRAGNVIEADIATYLGHARHGVTAHYTPQLTSQEEAKALDHMIALAKVLAGADTRGRKAQLNDDGLAAAVAARAINDPAFAEELRRLLNGEAS